MTQIIGRLWNAFQHRMNAWSQAYATEALRRGLGAIGPNTELSPDLQADFAERLRIGDWVYIGPGGRFFARGGLTIADHVIIGPEVTIMTSMHNYREARLVPYDEVELLNPVEIGVACWIGYGAILMPGVALGCGCIVGAGAVVTKSFTEGSVIGGNPATVIGTRDMKHFANCVTSGGTYLNKKAIDRLAKVERMATGRKPSTAN